MRSAIEPHDSIRMASSDWLKIPYDAAWRLVMKDEGLELSGYIAFTAFFSLFPFLIFLAALAGFLGDRETADEFNAAMFEFMPPDVAATLAPAVREVIGSRQGGLLTVGILTTLWFASNGIEALRTGLNRAYGVSEERPIWWLRLQSIAFVIVGALIIFFLSLAVLLGPLIWRVLGPAIDDVLATEVVFVSARYVVAIFLLWGALMLLHRWLPNTKQAYSRVLPGVCISTLLWLVMASLFSWYIGNLADYSAFYGSLGGVAITLMFFYVSAVIFIFGAEINAVWRDRTGRRPAPQDVNGEGEEKVG
ncbi:MAG: YihY/virulence factor BrkB family protein [Geminicoccaceae bacterium]|nr:YihY/virulence factor BrkB family protein [Geminicoccaceae bacterium]